MPNGGKNDPTNSFVAKSNPNKVTLERMLGTPEQPEGGATIAAPAPMPPKIIDPKLPDALRRFQVQSRGGALSDRVKIPRERSETYGRPERLKRT